MEPILCYVPACRPDKRYREVIRLHPAEPILCYVRPSFDRDRYRLRKAEITQAIEELEDKLYTATQTVNFTPILDRITATLTRLVSASFETKKTLINSVIQRLNVGGGEIIHLIPNSRPFF